MAAKDIINNKGDEVPIGEAEEPEPKPKTPECKPGTPERRRDPTKDKPPEPKKPENGGGSKKTPKPSNDNPAKPITRNQKKNAV